MVPASPEHLEDKSGTVRGLFPACPPWHTLCYAIVLLLVHAVARTAAMRQTGRKVYAIVLLGRKSGFRAGFRPDSSLESLIIGPPAGRRADVEDFTRRIRPKSGPEARFPFRNHYCVT